MSITDREQLIRRAQELLDRLIMVHTLIPPEPPAGMDLKDEVKLKLFDQLRKRLYER